MKKNLLSNFDRQRAFKLKAAASGSEPNCRFGELRYNNIQEEAVALQQFLFLFVFIYTIVSEC